MSPTLRRFRLWLQASALLAGGLLGAAVPALGQIADKFIEDVPTYQNVPHNLPREPLNVHEDVRGELSPDPPTPSSAGTTSKTPRRPSSIWSDGKSAAIWRLPPAPSSATASPTPGCG